jgi:cobaltochelatase CobN
MFMKKFTIAIFFLPFFFCSVSIAQEPITKTIEFKTASGNVSVFLNPDAKILFFGVYHSAYPIFERAIKETNIPADLLPMPVALPPTDLEKEFRQIPFEKYDVIYILQIDQFASQTLVKLLKEAKQKNPKLRVIQGLHRGSHAPLIEAGIMESDAKNFQNYYYNFPSENFKRLLVYTKVKYLGEEGEILPPVKGPRSGYYHPKYEKKFFEDFESYLKWYKKEKLYKEGKPWVALFVQSRYVLQNYSIAHDAVIEELEKNGLNVCPISAHGDVLRNSTLNCNPSLMILQHHFGPEGHSLPKPGEETFLDKLGIPYLLAIDALRISREEWEKDVKAGRWYEYSTLSRHEMFGLIEPHIAGAKSVSTSGFALEEPIPERIEKFVRKAKSWLNLQDKSNSEKKIAIVYFHIYQSKADVGRAGAGEMGRYFDVQKSLFKVLHTLAQNGYQIKPLPKYENEILNWMMKEGRNIPTWSPNELEEFVDKAERGEEYEFKPILISKEKYLKWFKSKLSEENQKLVIEKHGKPPGKIMVVEREGKRFIVLPVINLSNVILAPQPDIGRFDPALLRSKELPPSHNFLAFYFWLQEEFKPDALIHFGAFGSDVFLPGKEVLLSKDCFPDLIIGNMPLIYVWATEVIGIGIIAKRRPLAVLIDHMTTPILPTELPFEFNELENKINQFLQIEAEGPLKEEYRRSITNLAKKQKGLLEQMKIKLKENKTLEDEQIQQLLVFLSYAKTQNSPMEMRVFGAKLKSDDALSYLAYMLLHNSEFFEKLKEKGVIEDENEAVRSEEIHRLLELIVRLRLPEEQVANLTGIEKDVLENLSEEIEFAKEVWEGLEKSPGMELKNLLNALNGKYIPPGPGGTPLGNPYVLPTGRNMYGISPQQIPTKEAWDVTKKLADEFLEKYKKEKGKYPKRVAFSLTGMTTFSEMGVMEAYILYLIGVKPIWTKGGLVSGFEIIPKAKLKRPRIDPLIGLSGIYTKNFPNLVELLDDAIKEISKIEEEENFVLETSSEIKQELLANGVDEKSAAQLSTIRFFGTKPGESGARLVWLLPRSGLWENSSDIFEVWEKMRSHIFGKNVWGEENKILYESTLKGREVVFTNWANNLYGPLTNHHYPEETGGLALAIELISGKKPEIIVNDLRNKKTPMSIPYRQVIEAELYATAFNKKWIQSQMQQGYQGAAQFMQLQDNLFQWEAVQRRTVSKEVWDEMVEIYVNDKYGLNIQDFFAHMNPYAYQQMLSTMIEAARKDLWEADEEDLNELTRIYATFVVQYGYNSGPYEGGNKKFHEFVEGRLSAPGEAADELLLLSYKDRVSKVEGAKLEEKAGEEMERIEGAKLEEEVLEETPTPPPEEEKISFPQLLPIFIILILLFLFLYGFFKKIS